MNALQSIRIFFLFTVVFLISSCHSQKQEIASGGNRPKKGIIGKKSPQADLLADTYTPWESFYAPFNLRINNPVRMTVSGRATMQKDRYINFSLRMMGIEVAQLWIDNDSILMADKFHKLLVTAPFSAVTDKTGMNMADLQSLLLGQAFYPGRGTINSHEAFSSLFQYMQTDSTAMLIPRKMPQDINWCMILGENPEPVLEGLVVQPGAYEPFEAIFGVQTATPAGTVAAELSANGVLANRPMQVNLFWNLQKAEFNGKRTCARPDFKGYTRLTPAQLIESLKQGL